MVATYPGLLLTQICRCHVSVYDTEPHSLSSNSSPNPSIPVVNTNPLAAGMIPKTPQIIDVDFLEDEKSLQQLKTLATECNGHTLVFPDGKSPHTAYPFALHDTCILPWDYAIQNGKMSLFSKGCTRMTEEETRSCRPCQQLRTNQNLENIVSRIRNRIHENTDFVYHGFSGLQEILQRKTQQIEFYRLRGLNQARQLLGKAVALSENKRLLMAIASGKMQRVDQVISIGLRQKKGVRGLLASVIAAAHGHYRPKSYTEEEDMNALLIWRLSGNRVAGINQRSNGAPSVSYLKTRSIVPPLIPSHAQPTEKEVQTNTKATLLSVMDQIQGQIKGKVLHTVVMFGELATEKRIRWDPKTNHFVGICRQHAHRTSMEFINEGDLEELFRHLNNTVDDEKVHYAGEVV
jgi:hypothetical protein